MICSTENRWGGNQPVTDRSRSAFTLLELILVLVVLAVMAGMAWPQMTSFLRRESVLGNVEQVRQVLDGARVKAVNDGITYQFRFEPNGRKYVLLPQDVISNDDTSYTSSSSSGSTSDLPGGIERPIVHELSEDCYFYVDNTSLSQERMIQERLGDPWLEMVSDGMLHRDVSWSPPILYAADGSASDGSVTVVDDDRRVITLSVRGLTGAVVTSRLDSLPERYGAQ